MPGGQWAYGGQRCLKVSGAWRSEMPGGQWVHGGQRCLEVSGCMEVRGAWRSVVHGGVLSLFLHSIEAVHSVLITH